MGGRPSKDAATSDLEAYESQPGDWPWVWGFRDSSLLDWKLGLSADEIQARALRQTDLPLPITESVFLGDAASVRDATKLRERGIAAVLNMAGPAAEAKATLQSYREHNIRYQRIDAEDEVEYPLLRNDWEEALRFLETATAGGGKCVVHCVAGQNRSVLVVAAYFMLKTKTPVLETVRRVRRQRGNVALSNEGFQQQLVAMARKHNLLGGQPGTSESIVPQVPQHPENDWMFAAMVQKQRKKNPLDRLTSW